MHEKRTGQPPKAEIVKPTSEKSSGPLQTAGAVLLFSAELTALTAGLVLQRHRKGEKPDPNKAGDKAEQGGKDKKEVDPQVQRDRDRLAELAMKAGELNNAELAEQAALIRTLGIIDGGK